MKRIAVIPGDGIGIEANNFRNTDIFVKGCHMQHVCTKRSR